MKQLIYLSLIGLLFGCSAASQPTVIPSPTAALCLGFVLDDNLTCTVVDEGNVFLQSTSSDSVTISDDDFTISIRGLVQLRRFSDRFVINALEGNTVVTIQERTHVLRSGQTLTLQIIDDEVQAPDGIAEQISADNLTQIASDRIPRPEETDAPNEEASAEMTEEVATESVVSDDDSEGALSDTDDTENVDDENDDGEAIVRATASNIRNLGSNIDEDCEPRRAWNTRYTVVAGDVMEFIARDFGTTVREMAQANCIINPSVLVIGQVLRVPRERATLTSSPTAFRADETTLTVGECTVLRWDAFDAQSVYLDDEQTTTNTQRICPEATTTYTLRVVYRDDSETSREIRITVNP
ncbi:MAG: LysM domain-containing protein [Anaerolineae bacterium]|nr:LysM domain-containing protein [Anaerolineae bacterium]MDQ7034129.1 LysM domain-containing protein [Anaerolineae bacterium]